MRTNIDALLDLLTPEEIQNALRWIDIAERWNLPADEADERRRRISARRALTLRTGCYRPA